MSCISTPEHAYSFGHCVKTPRNLEKKTLFNCHFMPLNWPIFGIFPSLRASPSPGLHCHTNISLGRSGTHVQRSPQCLSFCFINWLSPLFSTRKGSARKPFSIRFLATYRLYGWVIQPHCQICPQTYYTIDRLYHRYAAPGRQREREVISAVKLLNWKWISEFVLLCLTWFG
jgi:hypothetical protein